MRDFVWLTSARGYTACLAVVASFSCCGIDYLMWAMLLKGGLFSVMLEHWEAVMFRMHWTSAVLWFVVITSTLTYLFAGKYAIFIFSSIFVFSLFMILIYFYGQIGRRK